MHKIKKGHNSETLSQLELVPFLQSQGHVILCMDEIMKGYNSKLYPCLYWLCFYNHKDMPYHVQARKIEKGITQRLLVLVPFIKSRKHATLGDKKGGNSIEN